MCVKLCAALTEHCKIAISIADFALKDERDDVATIFPAQLAEIRKGAVLLVITCSFLTSLRPGAPDFKLAPESIKFHLFADSKENIKISDSDRAEDDAGEKSPEDIMRLASAVSESRLMERMMKSNMDPVEMLDSMLDIIKEFPQVPNKETPEIFKKKKPKLKLVPK